MKKLIMNASAHAAAAATESTFIVAAVALATVLILPGCNPPPLRDVHDAQVKKTERIEIKDREQYMVFTSEGVFKNVDDSRYAKHNSADLYAEIEPGQVCDFQVTGERNPKTSEYANIITARCK